MVAWAAAAMAGLAVASIRCHGTDQNCHGIELNGNEPAGGGGGRPPTGRSETGTPRSVGRSSRLHRVRRSRRVPRGRPGTCLSGLSPVRRESAERQAAGTRLVTRGSGQDDGEPGRTGPGGRRSRGWTCAAPTVASRRKWSCRRRRSRLCRAGYGFRWPWPDGRCRPQSTVAGPLRCGASSGPRCSGSWSCRERAPAARRVPRPRPVISRRRWLPTSGNEPLRAREEVASTATRGVARPARRRAARTAGRAGRRCTRSAGPPGPGGR